MNGIAGVIILTFREVWAKKITLGLFIVCTLLWLLMAFALNLDIVEGSISGIRIFGQTADAPTETRIDETGNAVQEMLSLQTFVTTIESVIAGLAYWVATLLGLFAVAALMPAVLERGHVDLLFSKPLHRLSILAGHIAGVALVALLLSSYLLGMVFIVISLKTGIWNTHFLLAIPIVVTMMLVMYGAMVLVAIRTESTALSLIVSYGLIVGSLVFLAHEHLIPQINPPWRAVFVALYHVLPNFAEVTEPVAKLARGDDVTRWYPFYSSVGFGVAMYLLASVSLMRRDL